MIRNNFKDFAHVLRAIGKMNFTNITKAKTSEHVHTTVLSTSTGSDGFILKAQYLHSINAINIEILQNEISLFKHVISNGSEVANMFHECIDKQADLIEAKDAKIEEHKKNKAIKKFNELLLISQ